MAPASSPGAGGQVLRLMHARRPTEARAAAEEAFRLAPHLWETHFACGLALLTFVDMGYLPSQPNGDRGYQLLVEARMLSPRQAAVWSALAQHAKSSDRLRLYNYTVALEPQNANRYVERGLFRLKQDARAAAADLEKARELGGGAPVLVALRHAWPKAAAIMKPLSGSTASSRGSARMANLFCQLVQPGHHPAPGQRDPQPLRRMVRRRIPSTRRSTGSRPG